MDQKIARIAVIVCVCRLLKDHAPALVKTAGKQAVDRFLRDPRSRELKVCVDDIPLAVDHSDSLQDPVAPVVLVAGEDIAVCLSARLERLDDVPHALLIVREILKRIDAVCIFLIFPAAVNDVRLVIKHLEIPVLPEISLRRHLVVLLRLKKRQLLHKAPCSDAVQNIICDVHGEKYKQKAEQHHDCDKEHESPDHERIEAPGLSRLLCMICFHFHGCSDLHCACPPRSSARLRSSF